MTCTDCEQTMGPKKMVADSQQEQQDVNIPGPRGKRTPEKQRAPFSQSPKIANKAQARRPQGRDERSPWKWQRSSAPTEVRVQDTGLPLGRPARAQFFFTEFSQKLIDSVQHANQIRLQQTPQSHSVRQLCSCREGLSKIRAALRRPAIQ